MEEEHATKAPLSDTFLQFLETNGLDPSIYTAIDSTPRYILLKPGFESCIEEVEAEVKCKLEKLKWLLGFYFLPPHVQIAGSRAYREGKVYGIDVAFGAVVMALNTWGSCSRPVCAPGESGLEGKVDVFKEWTSRRPWKERKKANKSGTA
ncbi:hypothetical protein glysoja_043579 [Glycine soja]|uniref:Uncharacterized protein n=1 Tax=Glycine soja TaxID=3848 RepID=A0A0B2SC59_GLYSO|nr:hypothetical protein glysoja_043579 [Glycine soja]